VARGLVGEDDARELSEEAVSALIFLPGFSTAETVTDISGRGVGLDVVKEFVEEMNGAFHVRSVPGQGTTITITLPLTMAIIRALLVESSSLLYAIPISAVSEVVRAPQGSGTEIHGHATINLRDEILPVVPLSTLLSSSSPDDLGAQGDGQGAARPSVAGHIIVVRQARHQVGIGVTKVLGNAEVVVKSLGRHYREVGGLLGASILGNGRMAIILDVGALLDMRFAAGGDQGRADAAVGPRRARVLDRPSSGPGVATAAAAPALPVAAAPRPALESAADPQPPVSETEKATAPAPDPRLQEVFAESAVAASRALSEMLNEDIRVTFPELLFVPLGDVASRLGGEDLPVVRVYVDLKEGITGGHLLVVPLERALQYADKLLGRAPGTTVAIGDEETSTFSELGNILSASFLNSIADRLGVSIHSEVPDVRVDMCLPTIDAVLARFHEPGSHILLTTTEVFAGHSDEAVFHMLLFLERQSLALLEETLARKAPSGADR
jgi:chemotaxis protein CheY-P-specific phosphatase CheC/chemotaxis signal transduction protein